MYPDVHNLRGSRASIPFDMETPDVNLLEQCLTRTLDSKKEEDLEAFNWYMDKYLPYTTGLAVTFGPTVRRHYSTISEALDPNDPNEKAITIETEAFAVLIHENNLTKWTYYDEKLDDTYAKKYKYMPCNDRKPTGDPVKKDALVLEYEVDETDGASILRIYSPKARGKCNTPLLLRVKSRTANNCASLSGRHTAVHVS